MSASPARHLRVLDDAGQVHEYDGCPRCVHLEEEIRGLETEKRSWRAKFYAATSDREKQAKKHELWPTALKLFELWRTKCNHPGVAWTADHFWTIERHLRDPSLGEVLCRQAIEGAAFDPFISPKARRNGTHKTHDDWDLVFRSPDKVRDFAARAPRPKSTRFLEVPSPPEEGWLGSDYVTWALAT